MNLAARQAARIATHLRAAPAGTAPSRDDRPWPALGDARRVQRARVPALYANPPARCARNATLRSADGRPRPWRHRADDVWVRASSSRSCEHGNLEGCGSFGAVTEPRRSPHLSRRRWRLLGSGLGTIADDECGRRPRSRRSRWGNPPRRAAYCLRLRYLIRQSAQTPAPSFAIAVLQVLERRAAPNATCDGARVDTFEQHDPSLRHPLLSPRATGRMKAVGGFP